MATYPRTPPRLERVFLRHPLYFVTCCTEKRRPVLANNHVHKTFIEFSDQAYKTHNIAVGRYVIMPDHLHLFVAGHAEFKLGSWIGTLKRILPKSVSGCVPATKLWQRGFFDHVLRSSESYSQKWNYVRENPARAGLVKTAEDWPYAGEVIDLFFG
jgi:putative transposase